MKFRLATVLALAATLLLTPCVEAKSIIQAGRDVTIEDEQTVDHVATLGGQITVKGLVEKNVVAVGGSIVLTSNAVVRGKVIAIGGVIARGSGSRIYGSITEINSATLSDALHSAMRGELKGWSLILNIISLCFFAIILIIALIMTLLIPRSLASIANAIEESIFKSLLWGFLVTLMIVPFFMLLAISIIGIFLIPLVFAALILTAIVGFVAVGSLVGHFVIMKIFPGYKKSLMKETLIGLSLLWILGWIPFYIGMIIKVLAITFGLGGVLLTISRRKARQ